jgi:hypothetical protein
MDRTLDYWYKDLEALPTGQIAKEHIIQLGFSFKPVDFVIGANLTGRVLSVRASKSSSVMTMAVLRPRLFTG